MNTVESGGSRVTTRATNVNKHPGTDAKKTLQVHQCRDLEVIRAEKEMKKEAKEAKEESCKIEVAQREVAQQKLEEYRAQQAASIERDDAMQPASAKGKSTLSFFSEIYYLILGGKRGQKRIAPEAGDNDSESEQAFSVAKKAKTLPNTNISPPVPSQHDEKQAVTPGHPAEGGDTDEDTPKTPVPRPPPMASRDRNAVNKPKQLRRTGIMMFLNQH